MSLQMVFVCPIDGKTDFREAFQNPNPLLEYPPLEDCFQNNNKKGKTDGERDTLSQSPLDRSWVPTS